MYRNEMISAIIAHKDNLRQDELKHHGILGQKWGVRNYQNKDGSLTPEGREHYGYGDSINVEGSTSSARDLKKQLKINAKNYKKFLKTPFDERDYSYRGLAKMANLGQDYIDNMEKLENNKNDTLKEINEDFQDYKSQIGVAKASVGVFYAQNYPSDSSNGSVKSLANEIKFCVLDDGDEGLSIALYAKEKGIVDKCQKNYDKIDQIAEKAGKITEDAINENIKINGDNGSKTAYWMTKDAFVDAHRNTKSVFYNDNSARTFADQASNNFYQKQIQDHNIKSSEIRRIPDLIIKANPSKQNSRGFWSKIASAVQALGYENMDASEMTDAQWEKVGEKMNEMSN